MYGLEDGKLYIWMIFIVRDIIPEAARGPDTSIAELDRIERAVNERAVIHPIVFD